MHFNLDWAKKHKWLLIGIGVVVFVYIYLKDSASASSEVVASGATDTSLQQAELNAATQLQMSQVQANAQVQTLNAQSQAQAQQTAAQLTENQQNVQGAVDVANIQAGVQNNQTIAQQNIAESANQTQQTIQTTALATQQNIAQFADQTQTQIAGLAAQTAQTQINDSTALGLAQAIAPVEEENIAAGVEENQINAEENFRNSTIAQAVALQAAGKGGGGVINNLIGAANGATGLEAVQSTNFANANVGPSIVGSIGSTLSNLFK